MRVVTGQLPRRLVLHVLIVFPLGQVHVCLHRVSLPVLVLQLLPHSRPLPHEFSYVHVGLACDWVSSEQTAHVDEVLPLVRLHPLLLAQVVHLFLELVHLLLLQLRVLEQP